MANVVFTAQGKPIDPKKKFRGITGRVTVYNLATGKADTCHPIDAKERIQMGDWSYDPVGPEKPEPPAALLMQESGFKWIGGIYDPVKFKKPESNKPVKPVKRSGKKKP